MWNNCPYSQSTLLHNIFLDRTLHKFCTALSGKMLHENIVQGCGMLFQMLTIWFSIGTLVWKMSQILSARCIEELVTICPHRVQCIMSKLKSLFGRANWPPIWHKCSLFMHCDIGVQSHFLYSTQSPFKEISGSHCTQTGHMGVLSTRGGHLY